MSMNLITQLLQTQKDARSRPLAQNNQGRKGLGYPRLQIKREPMEFIPPRMYRINMTTQKLDPTSQVTRKKICRTNHNPIPKTGEPQSLFLKDCLRRYHQYQTEIGPIPSIRASEQKETANQSLCSEVPTMKSHPQMGEPPFLNVSSNHNLKRLPESLPIDSPMCAIHQQVSLMSATPNTRHQGQ